MEGRGKAGEEAGLKGARSWAGGRGQGAGGVA